MNKNGPIVLIEDDQDDQMLLTEIFLKLNYPNEIIFFNKGKDALEYFMHSADEPFLILSDINMPVINGIDLRTHVKSQDNADLKCIPYLLITQSATPKDLLDAYMTSVQGFFIKPYTFEGLQKLIQRIIEYWQVCEFPALLVS